MASDLKLGRARAAPDGIRLGLESFHGKGVVFVVRLLALGGWAYWMGVIVDGFRSEARARQGGSGRDPIGPREFPREGRRIRRPASRLGRLGVLDGRDCRWLPI